MTFILGVALSARQTREGVRSIAHGPAHPVDGSRPHSRARRIFPHGESNGIQAGLPARSHAHAYARCLLPVELTLFATHLRPPSARHLEPWRLLGWPWRSSVRRCGWAVHACVLRAGCGARVLELRAVCARVALCTYDIPRAARAELGSILDPDNDSRCFGDGKVHIINVVRSSGRVAFVPRRTWEPPHPYRVPTCAVL